MLFLLAACVPVPVLPPVVPMTKGQSELGIGASYTFDEVVKRDLFSESTGEDWASTPFAPTGGLDAMAYYRYAISKNFEAGALLFYGQGGGGPGGGVYLRAPFKLSKSLTIGVEGQAGLLWYAVGVPIGYQVVDRLWLQTEPMYRAGTVVVPLGLTYRLGGGWMIGGQGLYLYTAANETAGTEASGRFGVSLAITKRMGKDDDDGDSKKSNKKDDKKDGKKEGKKDGKKGGKKGDGGGSKGTNR